MDITTTFPVDLMTWRIGVMATAALAVWGDRLVALVRGSRSRPDVEALVRDFVSDDERLAGRAAQALAAAPAAVDRLALLLTHPAPEVGARAAAALEASGDVDARRVLDAHRRFQRLRAGSHLPPELKLSTLNPHRVSRNFEGWLPELICGRFVEERRNLVFLGASGCGKTHVAAALGHALLEDGRSVLYRSFRALAEELSAAQAGFYIERELERLDAHDVLIVDGVGPVPLAPARQDALHALAAHRAGRRSTIFTSALSLRAWSDLFPEPAGGTTYRTVEGALVFELTTPIAYDAPLLLTVLDSAAGVA